MLTWMRGFGRVWQVGVEGTGSYGAELTRQLPTGACDRPLLPFGRASR